MEKQITLLIKLISNRNVIVNKLSSTYQYAMIIISDDKWLAFLRQIPKSIVLKNVDSEPKSIGPGGNA